MEARTRLALAKGPMTRRSVVVVSQSGSCAAFEARYRALLRRAPEGNVLPLFDPGPRVLGIEAGPYALLAVEDCDRVFFESVPARPADATKALDIAMALARLSLAKQVSVSAGMFAASDPEAMLLEQNLAALGVPKNEIVAGWLSGLAAAAVRFVRVPAATVVDLDHDACRCVDILRYSHKKRTRR